MEKATRTIPIVFVQVIEPSARASSKAWLGPAATSPALPNSNTASLEKWVELLKQIAPHVTRAAVIRDPTRGPGIGQFAMVQAIAPSLGMELKPINLLDVSETERTIAAFARSPNGGLIVTVGGTAFNRDLIIALAAKHRLPAVYPYRYFASAGSLMSYGPDTIEQHRRAAGYVDRILKGEKPADLPVQAPTKYELVINLKTAKALGLSVPPSVLARADAVIE